MKKLLALVLAVVMMMGFASVAFAETDSLQAVQDAGVLKVGVEATFAPLTFKDADGNIVGYEIDLMNAVAEKLGVQIELVEIAWADIETALNDGTVDCVWSGLAITEERAAVMTLSDAYLANTTSLMVAEGVASLEDLAGKTIAIQAGSSMEELLCEPEFSDFAASVTVIGMDTYEDAFTALLNEASTEAIPSADDAMVPVDAVLISGLVASYNITSNEAFAGYTVIENLSEDPIGIGFAKGNYKLCGAVEEALYALAQDGTLAAITTEWFGSDISLIGK
ncbi:MAG: transporter substrate-binding domain-containing protein [Clostridia bacterium]|nr:transporter substrate-binding domain-containing protein [Clostridia bacterium]